MIWIDIQFFKNFDKSALYEYFSEKNETNYKICIPKKALYLVPDNYTMFTEYVFAAYAGQQFFEMADSFWFFYVAEKEEAPFTFLITTNKIGKLVDLLYLFIQFFCVHDNKELIEEYEAKALDYYIGAFEDVKKVGPYGLLCVARECLEHSV